jgi:hypothetical protein
MVLNRAYIAYDKAFDTDHVHYDELFLWSSWENATKRTGWAIKNRRIRMQ